MVIAVSVNAIALVIHVPGDYPTIQQAINNSSSTDTVMVANGLYHENLTISNPIVLIGESMDNTIIDGSGAGDVVAINASDVSVSGFAIRNSGPIFHDSGIELTNSLSCEVSACQIYSCCVGIQFVQTESVTVARCIIFQDSSGIILNGDVQGNYFDVIENNRITDNLHYGVQFAHIGANHVSNIVRGNFIAINREGIDMITSQTNMIVDNDIQGNADYGAYITMCMGGGQDNQFHHNNFISNGDNGQAYDMLGNNFWYQIEGSEGNHWSDYNGNDIDSNGIGDDPWIICGGATQDLFPIMRPLYASISGTVTDEDGQPISNVLIVCDASNASTHSNGQGHYELDTLYAGVWPVSFSRDAYRDTTICLVPTTLRQTTELNVVMRRISAIPDESAPIMPNSFELLQNYPNPFNSQTVISFNLGTALPVRLEIFDISGAVVTILAKRTFAAGHHELIWDANNCSSGIYYYRLSAGKWLRVGRMALLK
jgi:nitrous oxidase accessory protein NosD